MHSETNSFVKDLDFAWSTRLGRTVLVDNNPMSFIANPENGILVSSFYGDQRDTALPVVLELLEELGDSKEDIRPILDSRFGLREFLHNYRKDC